MSRFWVISPNAQSDGNVNYWLERSRKEKKVFVGYDSDKKHGYTFEETVKIGDCILIAHGSGDNRKLYLAGRVTSERKQEESDSIFYRDLDYLIREDELIAESVFLNSNNAWGESSNPGTIYELKSTNPHDFQVIDKLLRILEKKQKEHTMKKIIDILFTKKQIILQGPPGTGKTRLAEIIAKDLTKPVITDSPLEKINDFFINFNAQNKEVIQRVTVTDQLLKDFHQKFPPNAIASLTLEQYAIGTGTNDSFCWWIERGLKPLGYYFPGSAKSYRIYWSKDLGGYLKNGPAFKELSDEAAMGKIAAIISDFVINKNFEAARVYFGDSFLLKLLHTYYPDQFAPINSPVYLDNCLKLFGIDGTGLNLMQKNQKVQDYYLHKKKELNSAPSNLEFMRFLLNNFDIAGSITIDQSRVVSKGEYKLVQFHPAYSYEDFVRGIVAGINESGQVEYSVVNKILGTFAGRASENSSANYVLIIDEINRANIPAVLGELIYALEYRDNPVESLYDLKDQGNSISLPSNLFIIGTMNTADRSIGHIDYAIRRRFAFVDLLPSPDPVADIALPYFKAVSGLFIKNYDQVSWSNPELEAADTLAPDFRPKDVWLGHSYFIVPEEKDGKKYSEEERKMFLHQKMFYEVAPLLEEYIKDGVLSDSEEVKKVIREISENK